MGFFYQQEYVPGPIHENDVSPGSHCHFRRGQLVARGEAFIPNGRFPRGHQATRTLTTSYQP